MSVWEDHRIEDRITVIVHKIEFNLEGQIIRSSLTSANYDLSMFRLRPEGE